MLTLTEYAERKRLEPSFLRDHLLGDSPEGLRFPYFDETGCLADVKLRPSWDTFRWPKGKPLLPYGLWLHLAERDKPLLLVEGESDALTLWSCGFRALGLPGASSWRDDWKRYLGHSRPVLVLEPDDGGKGLLSRLTASLGGIWWVACPGYKDASDMYVALGPEEFTSAMQSLLGNLHYSSASSETYRRAAPVVTSTGEGSCLEIAQSAGVELKKKGAEWWGLCPLHEETKPSFHVHPVKNQWKCFGCGRGGGPAALTAAVGRK